MSTNRRSITFALVAGLTFVPAPALRAQGASPKLPPSARFAPADAAFYSASLGLGEQFQAVAKSKAFAKLWNLPIVQEAWKQAMAELRKEGEPAAAFENWHADPENRELLSLLGEMVSEEVFSVGGASVLPFLNLVQQLTGSMQFGPALVKLAGNPEELDDNQLRISILLSTLAENEALLRAPEFVFGFKIAKPDRALAQIARLEKLLKQHLEQSPLKGRLSRSKIRGGNFLSLRLDGQMIPWEQVPFKAYEEKPGQFDSLIAKLKGLRLDVSLGVSEGYLFLAIAESSAFLENIGKVPSVESRYELLPAAKFADRKLTSLSYTSKELVAMLSTQAKDIDDFTDGVREFVEQAGLTEEQEKKIRKDLSEFGADIKKMLGKPGALVAFSFDTPRGQETYTYDYGQSPAIDASKPLTILEHVGESPLLVLAGRSKYQPQNYATLVKWLRRGYGYARSIATERLEDTQRKQLEAIEGIALPWLERVDNVTAKMLIPSVADGQTAFVLDAKWKSKSWAIQGPATPSEMPMIEVGIVWGLTDVKLFRKAFEEYRKVLGEPLALIPFAPVKEIPAPETKKIADGTMFYYPIPPALDPRVLPNVGLSEAFGAFALSQNHTERLLRKSTLQAKGALVAANQSSSAAAFVDFGGLIDAAGPWVVFGVENSDIPDKDKIVPQVKTLLEIFKVLRTYSSSTYKEGAALVTHGELVIRDLD